MFKREMIMELDMYNTQARVRTYSYLKLLGLIGFSLLGNAKKKKKKKKNSQRRDASVADIESTEGEITA